MVSNNNELEKRLWGTADQLRANSGLKASEYSTPVLGLIFLRYADYKFTEAEKELAGKGGTRHKVTKEDYQAQGVIYVPENARFQKILTLPEGFLNGGVINEAMKAIEAENANLKDILPKNYNVIENATLKELLKLVSSIPVDKEGDIFGKIYEYFLGEFAMSEGAEGRRILYPHLPGQAHRGDNRTVSRPDSRPRLRFRRYVRPERQICAETSEKPRIRNRYLRTGEDRRYRPPLQDEPGRPRAGRGYPGKQYLL